jgi:hypothetical protein
MKGVLIAYYFSPDKRVGALRPTYWAEEISKHSDIDLDVLTATKTDHPKAIYIPNKAHSKWSFLIKDEGLTWKKDLHTYFESIDLSVYKFAIITGGPFMHFTLSRYLKKCGLKIILDYRDPFFNPIFKDKGLKKRIKQAVERIAIKHTDLIISVNQECHAFIGENNNSTIQRAVIPNGYDERKIPNFSIENFTKNTFFCAGKFYLNPHLFFEVLKETNNKIVQAGIQSEENHPFYSSNLYEYIGTLNQEELYDNISETEIGLVFTTSHPHLSTTKIYDYIGLNKKILVITEGEPHVGALNRELTSYPFYRWVKNNREDIKKAINELQEMEVYVVPTQKFSRLHGLKLLINEIRSLY